MSHLGRGAVSKAGCLASGTRGGLMTELQTHRFRGIFSLFADYAVDRDVAFTSFLMTFFFVFRDRAVSSRK